MKNSQTKKNDLKMQVKEAQPCLSRANTTQPSEVLLKNLSFCQKFRRHLKDNLILVLTILGIVLGIVVGVLGRINKPSPTAIILISFPGEMLLRILKMLILPLIISSLITGLAQLDPKSSGKMGSRAMIFYVGSTIVATITGIIMALIIRPGRQKITKSGKEGDSSNPISTLDALLDIIRNMFPENIIQACSQQITTKYAKKKIVQAVNLTSGALASNGTQEVFQTVRELKYVDGTNVMGLVVFCIIFGIFISQSKSEAQILYDFFFVMNELIMKIVALIMWYSPFGILCLVAANIIKIENMADTAKRLSFYMITVIIGLAIHALITIQLCYFVVTRKNPFRFLKGMLQAWLTAIGTASSSATLPITFRCLEQNNKVDKRISRFMLPLGATINMDGTALYQCVATIFIAQLNGIQLSLGQLIAISFASTATSIGVASIPSAALVTMLIVLGTVGLPTEDISYIVTVDWLLDRLRTSINVLGDAYGCGIVEHLSQSELRKLDEEAENEFNKIVAAQQQQQQQHQGSTLLNDDTFIISSINPNDTTTNNTDLSSQQQFNEFRKFDARRSSNRSQISFNGGCVIPEEEHPDTPSIVVMDAVRRRSRAMLFSSKIPYSVYSMPHISNYANNNSNMNMSHYSNLNEKASPQGVNSDSNV